MLRENLSINITPGGVPVVIHISQYDIGLRTFVFTPYTTEGTFTADTAASATLEGTKPDGNAFVHNCSYNSSTGVITYTVQDQLAAVAGKVWSKLVIRNTSGKAIGYAAIIWVVDMAGVRDGAVVSDSDISALAEFINEFGTINAYKAALDGALAAVGGPLVAATAAAMTDRTKVYVYTGSETGYTSGHWYYWNGSAWTDGGVYQSTGINTDKTLTVANMAADAKATGDAVAELIYAIKVPMVLDYSDIRNAYTTGSIGQQIGYSNTSASATIVNIIRVVSGQKYKVNVTYGASVYSTNARQSRCVDYNNVVTQSFNMSAAANTVCSAEFTAESDGYLVLTVDIRYVSIEIVGIDTYATDTLRQEIDELAVDTNTDAVKVNLINCFRAQAWSVSTGKQNLLGLCTAFNLGGWIDVKPNTTIGSNGLPADGTANRQATDFIGVDGYTAFTGEFMDGGTHQIWFTTKCYDANKAYLGDASVPSGSEPKSGDVKRTFVNGTKYIRLMLTPNWSTGQPSDLNGVYTNRMLYATFFDANSNTTVKKYPMIEVMEFSL